MTEKEELLKRTQEYFIKDIFAMTTTGIELVDVDTNYAKCRLNITEKHLNAENGIMGGAIFTLADFVFAVASNQNGEKTVTTTSQITYLGKAKTSTLVADCTVIKNGSTLCTYQINVKDDLQNPVAVVITSGFKLTGRH